MIGKAIIDNTPVNILSTIPHFSQLVDYSLKAITGRDSYLYKGDRNTRKYFLFTQDDSEDGAKSENTLAVVSALPFMIAGPDSYYYTPAWVIDGLEVSRHLKDSSFGSGVLETIANILKSTTRNSEIFVSVETESVCDTLCRYNKLWETTSETDCPTLYYFVEGDYFMDHTSKPCKLDRDVAEAISAYCQNNKSEIVEQYMKGKGSHEKKEGNSMNKRTKKSKKDKNESLTVSSPSRIINVFYEKVPWIVKSVIPQTDYTLLLQFKDGKRGVYDMWPLIQQEDGGDDTFVPLEDINFFMKAHKDGDSVAWNDDIDIAPEELYANCMSISEYKHWSAEDEDEEERADGKS